MSGLLSGAIVGFVGMAIGLPLLLGLCRLFGLYAIVEERTCRVYVLFGKVEAVLDEPGLHLLFSRIGWKALLVDWRGDSHVLDPPLAQ